MHTSRHTTSLSTPVSSATLPAVLVDRLVVRTTAAVNTGFATGTPATTLLAALAAAGLVPVRAPAAGSSLRVPLVPWPVAVPGGGSVPVGGLLRFSLAGGVWALAAHSQLWLNGLALLRSTLPDSDSLGVGLDGGTNVVGPRDGRWPALLARQAAAVPAVLSAAWCDVARALQLGPAASGVRFAVRDAEFSVDLPVPDARAVVRALSATFPEGAGEARTTFYQSTALSAAGVSVVWYTRRGARHVRKAYVKQDGLLRLEFAASLASGVAALTGSANSVGTFTLGPALQDALVFLARAASAHLAALEQHVSAVTAGAHDPVPLLAALAPLLALGVPREGRVGRQVSAEVVAVAQRTAADLLRQGIARPLGRDGKLVRTIHPVRQVLEALCSGNAPVLRRDRHYGACFVLAPAFSNGRAALFAPREPGA